MANVDCRRPLDDLLLAEDFAKKVLKEYERADEVAEKIVNAELGLAKLERAPTSTHQQFRVRQYREDAQREQLRRQILKELIHDERTASDDDIRLGTGGAKPREPKTDAQAYIVSGPPASGKSSIANTLAQENGAYMLDSDYAKRKFPEYFRHPGGASLVHKESYQLVFSSADSLFEYCVYSKHNVVIPLVGRTYDSVERVCRRLIEVGYQIHIINVALDRYLCTSRAYKRFRETGRYVPLSYVFDEVGNEPERIYFHLKRAYQGSRDFVSFSQLSTDVRLGIPAKVVEASGSSPYLVQTGGI